MGLFYEHQQVFNRAPVDITVTFDGQSMGLPPGVSSIPKIAVPFGKNQNPVMGTADPNNPHMSGGEYLLGVVGEDNCEPLTKEQWEAHLNRPCRFDEVALFEERYGNDPKARMIVHGKGKKTTANSRSDAEAVVRGTSTFEVDR